MCAARPPAEPLCCGSCSSVTLCVTVLTASCVTNSEAQNKCIPGWLFNLTFNKGKQKNMWKKDGCRWFEHVS